MKHLGALLADGRTSRVYGYGTEEVVKVLNSDTPQHWAELEAAFTSSVASTGVPAPEVRDVVSINGSAAIVFGRVGGPTMWERMLEHPSDVPALTREMVELQRLIHAAGVPDGLPSLHDRLSSKIDRAAELPAADRAAAQHLLASMPVGAALLHGDLHPGNVLLGSDGPVAIDWFDATVGHPEADVARSELLITATGATDLRHLPGATRSLVAAVHREFVSRVDRSPYSGAWLRLRSVGRLAESADRDPAGLVAMWRSGGSADDR